jgi:hypothetical protein
LNAWSQWKPFPFWPRIYLSFKNNLTAHRKREQSREFTQVSASSIQREEEEEGEVKTEAV